MSGNATNKLARLTPADMPESAGVNRVGPGWEQAWLKADAADTSLHLVDPRDIPADAVEVMVPGVPWQEPPRPPPAPSESELRAKLSEALAEQREAEHEMVDAVDAAERAADLLAGRQRALYSFADLDARIAAFTTNALRERGKVDLPDALREQVGARDRAFTDLTAAEQAHVVLSAELDAARQHVERRRQLATSAALSVLNTVIRGTVERHQRALLEAEGSYRALAEYDRFVSQRGTLPFAVASVLRNPPRDLRSMVGGPGLDTNRWRAALAALMADPAAEIEIDAG